MQTIKIVSNPYRNQTKFWVEEDGKLKEIDHNDRREENNELLSEKFVKGFFPFVAKEIVDIIIKEYGDNVSIIFEGPKESYDDFKEVCEDYNEIDISQSPLYLNNACDILDDILTIYDKSRGLIEKSVIDKSEIDIDTKKFLEATNDIIPLCIIGNYSSGKSTFINALIGADILPSGDDPVTSNVCKIIKSEYNSIAKIRFIENNVNIEILFDGNTYSIKFKHQSPLIYLIESELKSISSESINAKINKVIEILNNNSEDVSNLEIEIPFNNGLINRTNKKFFIFDTPGSDSETCEQHLKALEKQLINLSNGLIIFIVDRLDSKENVKLYNLLKGIKELDSRFTMIVVNKADDAQLPERGYFTPEEVKEKLNQAIPRNLYSNGIYYVSSIIGLGAKNNGNFLNLHNAEQYDLKKDKFSNPENKYYKSLYKYDIMPEQLRNRMIKDVDSCENIIFANSGLYAIEHEILTFANKYSSYNKCHQAELFLENVISITKLKIDERKEKIKKYRQALINEMERKKQELCNLLVDQRNEYESYFDDEYNKNIRGLIEIIKKEICYDVSTMAQLEHEIRNKYTTEFDLQKLEEKNRESSNEQKYKIKENISKLKSSKGINLTNLSGLVKSIGEGIRISSGNFIDEATIKKEIARKTSKELFDKVIKEFDEKANGGKNQVYDKSRLFYTSKTEEVKNKFLDLVNVTTALTNEQKNVLKSIIIAYEDINFSKKAKDIFVEKDFKIRILFITINKYDSKKLAKVFNTNIEDGMNGVCEEIRKSHKNSFNKWVYNLVETLQSNIAKFNPELLAKAEEIENQSNEINLLEKDRDTLENYLIELRDLIDWKNDN